MGEGDFRAALELVRACELAPDLESYRSRVMGVIEHVPGHIASYNEVDLVNEKLVTQVDPPSSSRKRTTPPSRGSPTSTR